MTTMKKYTKKGVFSYLDEGFIRLNFNNYYISRDIEGLDWFDIDRLIYNFVMVMALIIINHDQI